MAFEKTSPVTRSLVSAPSTHFNGITARTAHYELPDGERVCVIAPNNADDYKLKRIVQLYKSRGTSFTEDAPAIRQIEGQMAVHLRLKPAESLPLKFMHQIKAP